MPIHTATKDAMKNTQHLLISLLLATVHIVGVTSAPQAKVADVPQDYCANIRTGTIRSVSQSPCSPAERSLGNASLRPGTIRPSSLHPQLAARFKAARTVAISHGYSLELRSGWRSVHHQQMLFDAAISKYGSATKARRWVLPPAESLHTWGLAIDIKYPKNASASSWWFRKFSGHFGLCQRYKHEWWHFEALVSPKQQCPAPQ